jgi:methylated-DNA-[protein]-cysteine S-methyltransferase
VGECARHAVADVERYFSACHSLFTVELGPYGTPFQQRVWRALCAIPPGRPCSYGELAQALGSSARAVAAACRANPIPLLIPCHRVVAAHGPGGYMGATDGEPLQLKIWLLHHEAAG